MSEYVFGVSTKIPPSMRDELIARRRAGEKRKDIARELGVSERTVSRAIQARLIELDEYRPDDWMAHLRTRRREGWERIRAIFDERDRVAAELGRQAGEDAAAFQARLEEAEAEQRRERARRFQQAQRTRALAGQGLPTR